MTYKVGNASIGVVFKDYKLKVASYLAATPLAFSQLRIPPSPSIPNSTGSISLMSADASSIGCPQTAMPNRAIGRPTQFQANAAPQTHPRAGRQPETNTEVL